MTESTAAASPDVAANTTSYDEVIYPSYVHAQTHPDRLASLATLFGMNPPAVECSRILELACGQGANLIPLATSYPDSRCLGIDLSSRQIASGREVINALKLPNIELRAESILEFPADAGEFDFIIAHGVYSWVPAEVRDKILEICSRHLSPSGVAVVSYNTFPGWHQRRMIRDMMGFHTRTIEQPAKRVEQAKAFLSFMTQAVPQDSAYGKSLHEEFRSLAAADDSYVFHEQLEEINEPQYFHEFADKIADHRLQYLSEVELSNLQFDRYPTQVADVLRNMELIQREQYLDFLMRRTFRQTLVCHDDVKLDRGAMIEQIKGLRIGCPAVIDDGKVDFRHGAAVTFGGLSGVQVTSGDTLTKGALALLSQAWPLAIDFNTLESETRRRLAGDRVVVQAPEAYQQQSDTLARHLLQSVIAGAAEIHASPPAYTIDVSEMPTVCPLARYQARKSTRITTRRHQSITLDPVTCSMISHLDGAVNVSQLLDLLSEFVRESDLVIQHEGLRVVEPSKIRELLAQNIPRNLNALASHGLLIG